MTNYKKTVLITGASRGIGRACAVELARTGHALVLNSRRPSAEMDETVRLCEEAGAEVRTLFFDVGSTEAARTAIEADIAANGAYWGVVYVIFGILGLMGFVALWLTIERMLFLKRYRPADYAS